MAKTKRVDGEDLTADCFLVVGDPDKTDTWHLPWKFSTEEKTKSHLRDALARFDQVEGLSAEEKKKAWAKLVRLCKEHGIHVGPEQDSTWCTTERRSFPAVCRATSDGKSRQLVGRAVVFDATSEDLGGFRERIASTAFDHCDMADVRCLLNHDPSMVLGRTKSLTLNLRAGSEGVDFECDAPDTTFARDLSESMARGDIDQCSFSFQVAPGGAEWTEDKDGTPLRTVRKISRLYDVSVVTYPAYPQTSSEIRSSADILSERPAGHEAAPASGGAVSADLLRRKLELEYYGRF